MSQSPQETRAAEAAAIRRRWISLGEGVALIAVVISGLTLWNNWSERRDSEASKTAAAQDASVRAGALVLVASGAGGRTLTLKPAAADQSVQSQTLAFPTTLGIAPIETTGEPRIEAGWFEHALTKAREAAHLPDDSRGDAQLPLAITTQFLADGDARTDVAVYDLGYSITGHWFGGHSVTLRGVSLVGHARGASAQARVDARWHGMIARK
jgi:hypothetical protein